MGQSRLRRKSGRRKRKRRKRSKPQPRRLAPLWRLQLTPAYWRKEGKRRRKRRKRRRQNEINEPVSLTSAVCFLQLIFRLEEIKVAFVAHCYNHEFMKINLFFF